MGAQLAKIRRQSTDTRWLAISPGLQQALQICSLNSATTLPGSQVSTMASVTDASLVSLVIRPSPALSLALTLGQLWLVGGSVCRGARIALPVIITIVATGPSQCPGHVITLDQWEVSVQVTWSLRPIRGPWSRAREAINIRTSEFWARTWPGPVAGWCFITVNPVPLPCGNNFPTCQNWTGRTDILGWSTQSSRQNKW